MRVNFRVLVVNAVAFFAVDLTFVVFSFLNGASGGGIDLVDKVQGSGAFQNVRGIVARIALAEEVLIVLAGNNAPVGICVNRFVNALEGVGNVLRIIADFQAGLYFIDTQISGFLLHVVLQCGCCDCCTHGMPADADIIHVDAVQIAAGVLQQVTHIGEVHLGGYEASGGRAAMSERIAGDDNEAAPRQLHHVHVLHLQVVLAAVLQNDKRKLVLCAGLLRNIHLSVELSTVADNQVDLMNFDPPAVALNQTGTNHADEDHCNCNDQPESLWQCLLFHN